MIKETLKLTLEALEYWGVHGKLHQPTEEAITAIKEALAQPDHIVDVNKMVAEQEPDWGAAQVHRWGLTMRDYFAAKAMKTYSDDTDELLLENAICAYKQADAMIKARQA